jgi:hypothetical protein
MTQTNLNDGQNCVSGYRFVIYHFFMNAITNQLISSYFLSKIMHPLPLGECTKI